MSPTRTLSSLASGSDLLIDFALRAPREGTGRDPTDGGHEAQALPFAEPADWRVVVGDRLAHDRAFRLVGAPRRVLQPPERLLVEGKRDLRACHTEAKLP
jgi:hypothetical protein